jgi:hypothetical protein
MPIKSPEKGAEPVRVSGTAGYVSSVESKKKAPVMDSM